MLKISLPKWKIKVIFLAFSMGVFSVRPNEQIHTEKVNTDLGSCECQYLRSDSFSSTALESTAGQKEDIKTEAPPSTGHPVQEEVMKTPGRAGCLRPAPGHGTNHLTTVFDQI